MGSKHATQTALSVAAEGSLAEAHGALWRREESRRANCFAAARPGNPGGRGLKDGHWDFTN
jgi:hypothetical protein